MPRLSDQIDEGEDQDPDQIHEMPVEPYDLHRAPALRRIAPAGCGRKDEAEIDHAAEDMAAMKARQDKEGRAEEALLNREPLGNQVRPLVSLDGEEGGASCHGPLQEPLQPSY